MMRWERSDMSFEMHQEISRSTPVQNIQKPEVPCSHPTHWICFTSDSRGGRGRVWFKHTLEVGISPLCHIGYRDPHSFSG